MLNFLGRVFTRSCCLYYDQVFHFFQPINLQSHDLVPLDQDFFMMKSNGADVHFDKNLDLSLIDVPIDDTMDDNIGLFQCAD